MYKVLKNYIKVFLFNKTAVQRNLNLFMPLKYNFEIYLLNGFRANTFCDISFNLTIIDVILLNCRNTCLLT